MKKIALISVVIASVAVGVGASSYLVNYVTASSAQGSDETMVSSNETTDENKPDNMPTTQVVERLVTSGQVWRPVQERVHDTVVQIFSHVANMDLLQPYRSPNQGTGSGSGFFINDKGEIITNAHVINEAKAIFIQIPSLGKRILDAEVVGLSPDRDLALLRVTPDSLALIQRELGSVPYLRLGDSDLVRRSDEVLALGYPLGQQSVKSTTGVVSGHEQHMIQTSAPLNPGNSGGPLVNVKGEAIGINTSGIVEAQNVGYAMPINDLKIILPDLYKVKLLRKPFLGMLFNNSTEAMVRYLGNPEPGGCYIVEVLKNSTLDKAGINRGDMLYEINSYPVDMFGEMRVPWSEDKISVIDYAARLALGKEIKLVVYRKGERKEIKVKFTQSELPAIREIYPGFEEIDYEVFAGMVTMPLSLNHLPLLGNRAPGLVKYTEARYQSEPTLIITHIFPNSQLHRSRTIPVGATINEVNGVEVKNLTDLRKAIGLSSQTGYLTLKASDNVTRKSDNILVVLPWNKVVDEESKLAQDYRYPMSDMGKEVVKLAQVGKSLDIRA